MDLFLVVTGAARADVFGPGGRAGRGLRL